MSKINIVQRYKKKPKYPLTSYFFATHISPKSNNAPCVTLLYINKLHKPTSLMRTLLTIVLTLILSTPLYAMEHEPSFIQVTGNASREITPDKFTIKIEISENDSKGKRPLQEQEREIITALKKINIDTKEQLRLADNSSDYFRRGISLATRHYELTLNSSNELVAAFDALRPLGLSSVTLTKAICTNLEQIRAELRREAIINARDKASEIASAIGQSIGSCFYIVDYNTADEKNFAKRRIDYYDTPAIAESALDHFTPEFNSSYINYSLQAKFDLLPLE